MSRARDPMSFEVFVLILLAFAVGIALFDTGCAATPATPRPLVMLTGDLTQTVMEGAGAWDVLGFDVDTLRGGYDDCPRDWYAQGIADCVIPIAIARVDNLELRTGVGGLAELGPRLVKIDALLFRAPDQGVLRWMTAHEVGHILLDVDTHIADAPAIMNPSDHPDGAIATVADLALACDRIQICPRSTP